MLIDISRYVNIVMEKLNSVGYYSEVNQEKLEKAISQQLSLIYDDKIAALSLKFEIDKHKGIPIDNSRYKLEYDRIRREIMTEAHDIALTSKLEPPALPEN